MKANLGNIIAITALLAAGLAGCVDPSTSVGKGGDAKRLGGATGSGPGKIWTLEDPVLSQKIYDKILFEPLPVVASDGMRLDNWMFRPETAEGEKIPAIVHLSPYYANNLPRGVGGTLRILRENFTERGYAVIGASVRGTGFSEGCFEIGGPRERQDYNELFTHIVKQPWSNGKIAAIGVSYDGTAPQGALIASHPALKTIVPIAAISEWYKYNFIKGVQINPQGWAFNTYYVALEQAPLNLHGFVPGQVPQLGDVMQWPNDIRSYATTRACPNQGSSNGITRGPALVDTQRSQVVSAPTGMTDPYWEERNFTRFLDKVRDNVSVLFVHGLLDYNVKTHNILPWYTKLQEHGVATKILLGQWGHAYPGTTRPNGLADWSLMLLRWFDYWLKDKPTGIMDEPNALIQDFAGVWRTEDNYPPSRVEPTKFYFGTDGTLKAEPGTGTAMFMDNGRPYGQNVEGAPANAVVFTTPALETPFRYSGEAIASLELSHSTGRGHVAVTVYNVTGASWRPVNWGYFNYNIRNGPDKYDPVLPNERFRVQVPLLPTDMVIAAGSKLAVVFAGQSTGGPGMLPPPSGGQTQIHLGTSYIQFPTLPDITPLSPQPLMLGPLR